MFRRYTQTSLSAHLKSIDLDRSTIVKTHAPRLYASTVRCGVEDVDVGRTSRKA